MLIERKFIKLDKTKRLRIKNVENTSKVSTRHQLMFA
jgi:hypothetical protein